MKSLTLWSAIHQRPVRERWMGQREERDGVSRPLSLFSDYNSQEVLLSMALTLWPAIDHCLVVKNVKKLYFLSCKIPLLALPHWVIDSGLTHGLTLWPLVLYRLTLWPAINWHLAFRKLKENYFSR